MPDDQVEQAEITPEKAAELLKTDMANMVKGVSTGKPLSPYQRNLLLQLCGQTAEVGFVTNQVQLAKAVGVDRKTVQRWLKQTGNPGRKADGRYDVAAWREWGKQNGLKGGAQDLNQTQLKAKNILLQNEKLEVHLAILRKKYVDVADVEKWTGEMVMQAKQVLLSGPASLAPQLVGISVPEAEKLLRDWLHAAMSALTANPLGNESTTEPG